MMMLCLLLGFLLQQATPGQAPQPAPGNPVVVIDTLDGIDHD